VITRKRWTNEEKFAVRDRMTELYLTAPTMPRKNLLAQAQDVLLYERRVVVNDQRVFAYKNLISAAIGAAKFARANQPAPVAELPKPAAKQEPAALADIFDVLLDALADRVVARLQRQQEEKHDDKVDAWRSMPAMDVRKMLDGLTIRPEIAIKKPTALVIGLNGAQMECVKSARPEVDFTFLTAEQALSHQKLKKDHTFLMTKFINHSVQGRYSMQPNLHYINGGVTNLTTVLHGLFHKKEQA